MPNKKWKSNPTAFGARTKAYFLDLRLQTAALILKNFRLLKRSLKTSLLTVVVPFAFVALLFILQYSLSLNEARSERRSYIPDARLTPLSPLQRCTIGEGLDSCYTFGYSPDTDPNVVTVMEKLAELYDIPENEVIGFDSYDAANAFLSKNRNSTQGLYHITFGYGCNTEMCFADFSNKTISDIKSVEYFIQYNTTEVRVKGKSYDLIQNLQLPMQKAIERALLNVIGGEKIENLDIDWSIKRYPHPELGTTNVISTVGGVFFFAALMFNFVIQLGQIVREKEDMLRTQMSIMGLIDSIYWLSFAVVNIILNTISAGILILSSLIFGFDFFYKNDAGLYIVLFFLFAVSLVPLSFFISTFLTRSRTAASIGFVIFLVGIIVQFVAGVVFDEATDMIYQVLLKLLPMAVFAKGLSDLSAASDNESDVGLRWEERFDGYFSIVDAYTWLIIDIFIYSALTWYFDNVLFRERRPWFFLTPYYWNGRQPASKEALDSAKADKKISDKDVLAERDYVRNVGKKFNGLAIHGITMEFSDFFGGSKFLAVDDLYLSVEAGKAEGLLGHNGAGKSTLINLLTGLLQPTRGDAYFFGYSLVEDMDKIRRNIGVAPQHDVLWEGLTASEHIDLFCAFKRLSGKEKQREIQERLEEVRLYDVRNKPAGQFSGGMQRRLSIAIALCGDPAIVFLDEPTSSMDVKARRDVWTAIESIKRDRVTILTTHSMTEADVLSDRIAIMKSGQVATQGTPLTLKQKFGKGLGVSVTMKESADEKARDNVEKVARQHLKSLTVTKPTEGVLKLRVPESESDRLPSLFEEFEEHGDELQIEDFLLSLTSMEEVFLTVADEEEHHDDDDDEEPVPCYKRTIWGKIICGVVFLLLIIVALVLLFSGEDTAELELPTKLEPWRSPEPPLFEPNGEFDNDAFFTVFVGDVSDERAAVAVRTSLDRVTVRVMEAEGASSWREAFEQTYDALMLDGVQDRLDDPLPLVRLNNTVDVMRAVLPPATYQSIQAVFEDDSSILSFNSTTTLSSGSCHSAVLLDATRLVVDEQTCPKPLLPMQTSSLARIRLLIAVENFENQLTLDDVPLTTDSMNAFEIQSYQNVTIGNYTLAINNSTTSINVELEATHDYTVIVRNDALQLLDAGASSSLSDAPETAARVFVFDGRVNSTRSARIEAVPEGSSIATIRDSDSRSVHVWLDDLKPDTAYAVYAFDAEDDEVQSMVTRFRTAPSPSDTGFVVFGATSCLGPAARPWRSLSIAAEEKLDFFISGGDTVYADGDILTAEYRGTWSNALRVDGLADVGASTGLITTWDDHEIDNDWTTQSTTAAQRTAAKRAYKEAMPAYYGAARDADEARDAYDDDRSVLYRRVRYGPVEVFVLDCRGERVPANKTYISQKQMNWVKSGIVDSDAPFKIIVNSVPITDMSDFYGTAGADDRWQGYANQREELLQHIESNQVPGVLFVSGDFHFGAMTRTGGSRNALGYNTFEVLAGPGGSNINPIVRNNVLLRLPRSQYLKFLDTHTYTRFTANATSSERSMTIDFVNDEGTFLFQRRLNMTVYPPQVLGQIDPVLLALEGSASTLSLQSSMVLWCALLLLRTIL